MDSANQSTIEIPIQLQQATASAWYTMRSPKTLGLLLAIGAIVSVGGGLLPPSPEPLPGITTEIPWVADLPVWLQPFGGILFDLGFAQIFRSLWFWLPVALLLLHSFIALADYAPASWQRVGPSPPPLDRPPHPLAHRSEYSVRLSDRPEAFLAAREEALKQEGFLVQTPPEATEPVLAASRRHWSWLGVVVFYSGLIVLIGALLASYHWLERDRLRLISPEITQSGLLTGYLTVDEVEGNTVQVMYVASNPDRSSSQTISVQPYFPTVLNGTLIFLTDLEPILSIEVRDDTGAPLTLTSPLVEGAALEKLDAPLSQLEVPIYFSIPEITLAFQISSDPAGDEGLYNVQVLQGEAGTMVENMPMRAGQMIQIENLSLSLALDYQVDLIVHRDPALLFYLLGLGLIISGSVMMIFLQPVQIWFISEIKGRGGQLYGVMEQQFGAEERMQLFLQRILGGEEEAD